MTAYRLYFLDANGGIQARQDFVAEDDGEAHAISGLLWRACADCYRGYELWQTTRRIAHESMTSLSAAFAAPAIDQLGRNLQMRLLELQEALLGSHWRAAQSTTLLAATESLRRSFNGNGLAPVTHQDVVGYICGKTGTKMMSLQLAEGLRLMLRGSRGFDRRFDDFFAVVPAGGHCVCGLALENGRQIVVPAIASSPIFAGQKSLEVLRAQGVASCVSTPVVARDNRIIGMFSIHRNAAWSPLNGELAQLRHIANDIAAAMTDPRSAAAGQMRTAV